MGVMEYFFTKREIQNAAKSYKKRYELLLKFSNYSDSWADMVADSQFQADLDQLYNKATDEPDTLNPTETSAVSEDDKRISLSKINLGMITYDDDEDDELSEEDALYKKKFLELYTMMAEDESDDEVDVYLYNNFPFNSVGKLNRSLPFHE